MCRVRALGILVLAIAAATVGWSQEAAPKNAGSAPTQETTATTDGNALSDVEKDALRQVTGPGDRFESWADFIAWWMTPKPFAKKHVLRIDENYAYPDRFASTKMQIVSEDDEFVWLKGIPPEDPNSPLYKIWARREANQAITLTMSELMSKPGAVHFLDFHAEEVPPSFMESLAFEAVTENLPTEGRWQMGFAVADMNEDGHVDLVFPPRRKDFPAKPAIYLGDGKGGFRNWATQRWPDNVQWDYGDVEVADFDGDGHQDAAFAIHFKPQVILYGDGNGVFARGERLESPDHRITARALTSADFDGDGRRDLAFVMMTRSPRGCCSTAAARGRSAITASPPT